MVNPETLYRPNFQSQVDLLHQQGFTEIGPWYLLPGTGFNVALQIDQFLKDLEAKNDESDISETLETSFVKIEQDINAFKLEYLCQRLVLPIDLERQIVGGKTRIIAPSYGGKLLVDTVSEKERGGEVKKSLQQIDEFLASAEPGSLAVFTSPPGWSGFNGITFMDSQTMIFQIEDDGKIRAFGIRTDMDRHQNQRLLENLGQDKEKLEADSEKEELLKIASSPVFLRRKPTQKAWTAEDIVDILRYVKDSENAHRNRTFAEVYEDLRHPPDIWKIDTTTQNLTRDLKQFISKKLQNGTFQRHDLEVALGTTVLKLAQAIRFPNYQRSFIPSISITDGFDSSFVPYQLLTDLQSIPGCNGGGQVSAFIDTLSPRLTRNSHVSESGRTLDCKCPFCGNQVKAIIENGKITCPNPQCQASVPYEC